MKTSLHDKQCVSYPTVLTCDGTQGVQIQVKDLIVLQITSIYRQYGQWQD